MSRFVADVMRYCTFLCALRHENRHAFGLHPCLSPMCGLALFERRRIG